MANVVNRTSDICVTSLPRLHQARHFPNFNTFLTKAKENRVSALRCKGTRRPVFLLSSSPLLIISATAQKLSDVEAVPLAEDVSKIPASPGIYAVYDKAGDLQYIGMTRRLSASLQHHVVDLPELCGSVKFCVINAPERAALLDSWKLWMEEHIGSTGSIPPGNMQGVTTWTQRRTRPSKQDIWLMPGPNTKLNITLSELIDKVIKGNKVVAFIKGSRTAPQCGFSHRVLTILNEHGIDYESVNVLDEEHNAGVREALKVYSQWPTIPQIYAYGEFIGGADILDEMAANGKIKEVFQKNL
ncbi:hypothetical protein KP509_17G082900 [Ceratopteris richardii]|uniref:Glutaredoxin domain-containing protein n=1 Tax=Ceratopteris richardii TaxID=49495 RepID=A0A8T2SXE7_CERRI|nr:hypothetical protein KP509_17G082900 [Ceratopteris richardii]